MISVRQKTHDFWLRRVQQWLWLIHIIVIAVLESKRLLFDTGRKTYYTEWYTGIKPFFFFLFFYIYNNALSWITEQHNHFIALPEYLSLFAYTLLCQMRFRLMSGPARTGWLMTSVTKKAHTIYTHRMKSPSGHIDAQKITLKNAFIISEWSQSGSWRIPLCWTGIVKSSRPYNHFHFFSPLLLTKPKMPVNAC